jgi:hypothetical protein
MGENEGDERNQTKCMDNKKAHTASKGFFVGSKTENVSG